MKNFSKKIIGLFSLVFAMTFTNNAQELGDLHQGFYIFQINDDFEDYPRMRKDEKSILQAYKLKLHKKTINELDILKINSRKIYQLIDFLMDLKV